MRTFISFLENLNVNDLKGHLQGILDDPSDINFLVLADKFEEIGEDVFAGAIRLRIKLNSINNSTKQEENPTSLLKRFNEIISSNPILRTIWKEVRGEINGWKYEDIGDEIGGFNNSIRFTKGNKPPILMVVVIRQNIYYLNVTSRETFNINNQLLSSERQPFAEIMRNYGNELKITAHQLPDELVMPVIGIALANKTHWAGF